MSKQSIAENMAALNARKPKPKKVTNAVSHKMKKALGDAPCLADNPIAIKQIKKTLIREGVIREGTKVSTKVQLNAVAEHIAGRSQKDVEQKYALANGYVNHALKRMFPNEERMAETLQNMLLHNSVLCNVIVEQKASEMSGRDAAVAAGIMTQRYTELKKARESGFTPDTPVSIIISLEQTMARVKQVHGNVIDAEAAEVLKIKDK